MLAWLFGAETSFTKALIYNLLTFSVLSLMGAIMYSILVGIPMVITNYTNK